MAIVDFSDIEHIKEIVAELGIAENIDDFKMGKAILSKIEGQAKDKLDSILLEQLNQAGSKHSPIVYAMILAAAISPETKTNTPLAEATSVSKQDKSIKTKNIIEHRSHNNSLALNNERNPEAEEKFVKIRGIGFWGVQRMSGNVMVWIQCLEGKLLLKHQNVILVH